MRRKLVATAMACVAAVTLYWIVQAGELEPPGPPAPTMEDLSAIALDTGLEGLRSPIWPMTVDGTSQSIEWVDHGPNPRFAIHDADQNNVAGNEATLLDDLVLDKETGLVWLRDADRLSDTTVTWYEAIQLAREADPGNRLVWRLPTIEELLSLNTGPQVALPVGHPFLNACCAHWSRTTDEADSTKAWFVHIELDLISTFTKTSDTGVRAWPVRGGNGYASGNW